MAQPRLANVRFYAATPDRWADIETLFGERGACAGCWCMWWRLSRSEWNRNKAEGNRKAFRRLVRSGAEPGVLAYAGGKPVGWCAIAPRADYPSLERSRTLKRIDARPVWSVTCFFVCRKFRRQGLSSQLLKAAVDFARKKGARFIEGYPHEPKRAAADAFVYTGLASSFRQAGFREVARVSKNRAVMRLESPMDEAETPAS